jgi:putative Holliday junction resolvase
VARTLGLDWGEKRIGVAIGDAMGWTARGVSVIPASRAVPEIAAMAAKEEVGRIVVGMPVHDDGRPSKSAPKVLAFVETLKAAMPEIPVETWDESNTSWEANRILQERGVSWKDAKAEVDRVAAAVMLQSWLDAHAKPPAEDDR